MIFYITESIGGTRWKKGQKIKNEHVKVGIASDVEKRLKEYEIVLPYISAVRQIVVRKSFARNLEKMFKYYLREFRLSNSECYSISPKQAIFFLSRCFISNGKVIINAFAKNNKYLFYLDSIYFGKKIPLFFLNRVRRFKKNSYDRKYEIEIIKEWGRKRTRSFLEEINKSNYEEIIEDKYNFSKNILYHFLKVRLNRIQDQINTWNSYNENNSNKDYIKAEDIFEFFSQQLFHVLREYNTVFKKNKKKRKVFIKDFVFFEKKLKNGLLLLPNERQGYVAQRIFARYFYSLSWMLDTKGSPSNVKSDPFMFKTDLRYWTRFNTSVKGYNSLLGYKS